MCVSSRLAQPLPLAPLHAKFDQYGVRVFGMKKADQLVVGPWFGLGVEEREACLFEPLHFSVNIGYVESNMVYAFPLLFDEAGDDTVRILSLQQLDLGLSLAEEGRGHLLAVNLFHLVAGGIEKGLEEGYGGGEIFDGDANVFDFTHGNEL